MSTEVYGGKGRSDRKSNKRLSKKQIRYVLKKNSQKVERESKSTLGDILARKCDNDEK